MSVTIRKKEEPRNTPLLNFLLVACVPVLLAFLGGISTGKSSGVNIKEYEAKLEDAEKRLRSTSEDLKLLSELNIQLDSLFGAFRDEIFALEAELPGAMAEQDGGFKLSQWTGKRSALFTNWQERTETLRRSLRDKISEPQRPSVDKGVALFSNYQIMTNGRLTNAYNHQQSLQAQGQVSALEQARADLEKERENMAKEDVMRGKDRKISELEDELSKYKKAGGTDNSPAKERIKMNVQAIRDEVIPLIPTSLLSKKGDQARELLRGKLDAISDAVQSIK